MRELGKIAFAAAVLLGVTRHGEAACAIDRYAELPVMMRGLKPMVSAKIDGKDVSLVADSGAFFSSLTPGTAAELGLRLLPMPMGFTVRGIGGSATPLLAKVKAFGIAAWTIPMDFLVTGSEVGGAGLLGQNLLGFHDVEYDLGGGAIRLMRARDCGDANLAYWAGTKPVATIRLEPTDRLHKQTVGIVLVNGVRTRAIFDTGAPGTLLSLAAAARAGVRPSDSGVRSANFSSGIGRRVVNTWIAPFASLDIGGEQVLKTHLRIADLGPDSNIEMLIGADFFLSHRVFVANTLHRMFFTYQGGQVFSLATSEGGASPGQSPPAAGDPAVAETIDADGYARRAAIKMARRDAAGALADLDKAVALAADDANHLQQRAGVHAALDQPLLAMADLDRAIALKPDLVEARLHRATLRLRGHDQAGARVDLDAAAAATSPAADARLEIAGLYGVIDAFGPSIAQFDLWIAAHPDDARRSSALNSRCWQRALWGRDLDRARSDCDAALRARPNTPAYLDSRGLVELRLGEPDKALKDYDAALAQQPRLPWSLYGRGIVRQRLGHMKDGEEDIAAAVAIQPGLAEDARRYGIVPPG